MIVIDNLNEGAVVQNVDGKFMFKVGKRYSKAFDSLLELNEAWRNNTIWSDDGKQVEAEAKITRAKETTTKLVATATIKTEK